MIYTTKQKVDGESQEAILEQNKFLSSGEKTTVHLVSFHPVLTSFRQTFCLGGAVHTRQMTKSATAYTDYSGRH